MVSATMANNGLLTPTQTMGAPEVRSGGIIPQRYNFDEAEIQFWRRVLPTTIENESRICERDKAIEFLSEIEVLGKEGLTQENIDGAFKKVFPHVRQGNSIGNGAYRIFALNDKMEHVSPKSFRKSIQYTISMYDQDPEKKTSLRAKFVEYIGVNFDFQFSVVTPDSELYKATKSRLLSLNNNSPTFRRALSEAVKMKNKPGENINPQMQALLDIALEKGYVKKTTVEGVDKYEIMEPKNNEEEEEMENYLEKKMIADALRRLLLSLPVTISDRTKFLGLNLPGERAMGVTPESRFNEIKNLMEQDIFAVPNWWTGKDNSWRIQSFKSQFERLYPDPKKPDRDNPVFDWDKFWNGEMPELPNLNGPISPKKILQGGN